MTNYWQTGADHDISDIEFNSARKDKTMITVEEIDGEQYTVIWSDLPYVAAYLDWTDTNLGKVAVHGRSDSWLATALPALPRRPKPEDARLLYRYASEGIKACVKDSKITHAINSETGRRVEIAIK